MVQQNNMRTLLFPIENGSYFSSMFRLAKALSDSGNFKIIMVFPIDYPGIEENKQIAIGNGFSLQAFEHSSVIPGGKQRIKVSRLKAFLGKSKFLQELYYFLNEYRFLIGLMNRLEFLFEDNSIDCLILPAQNRFHFPYFAKVAESKGLPVVLAPNWFAGSYELIESLQNSKFHNLALPRFILKLFLGNNYVLPNPLNPRRSLIPVRFSDVVLRRYFKIIISDPWILHSGFSNAVLCESEWVKDFAISLGLNSSNLFVTGSIAHDEMFEVLEKRKNAQKSVIVVAIPPDMFPSSRYKNLEFTDFIEMLDFLAKSVTKSTNMRVVASPHPSLNGDHIDYLKRMGFEIAENGVHVELCNASFFIASISATIQWAMAITVPVINYDLYRFDYPDYLGVSGVVKCETKADFLEILQKFCQLVPQVNLEEIPEHSYYGVVDGRAVDRIEARIQSLF